MDDKYFIRKILVAIVLGILIGFLFKEYVFILDVVGKVFLRTMQMVIPLLVLGQVVQALGSLEKKDLSALGIRTIAIFGISSLLAAYWGILFTLIMQPGKSVTIPQSGLQAVEEQSIDLSETIISFFPQNIMDSLSRGSIIQIIIFAIFMGIAVNISVSQKPNSLFLPLLMEINDIIMQIIRLVMKFAPIGIFAMIAVSVGNLGLDILLPMVQYLLVFALATLTFLLVWVLLISFYSKKSIKSIILGMK